MYTMRYGDGGEHVPLEFTPLRYAATENGAWQLWTSGSIQRGTLERRRQIQRAGTALSPAPAGKDGQPLPAFHSLLVPAPNAPAGWFLRWDLYNGWTGSQYLPQIIPMLHGRPLPESSPFGRAQSLRDLDALIQFSRHGKNASYHYACDSGAEDHLGREARDKALEFYSLYPHLEKEMLAISQEFLWNFRAFTEKGEK